MTNESKRGRVAVIVPAHNAANTLRGCLEAILGSTRKPDEIVLYNDGSTDNTGEIAKEFAVRVITNPVAPAGPARARNIGARSSSADLYVFIDSDVVVDKNAIGLLIDALEADNSICAAFGSYDDSPKVTRRAALYANLRHHWIHQNDAREAATFWSGIGAIRQEAFWSAGGFDESSLLEDVDLGLRLHANGERIRLIPEALGSHCKNWGLVQLWHTDIFHRAVPWAEFLASGKCEFGHLNSTSRERWSAVAAHSVWFLALGCLVSAWFIMAVLAAAASYLYLNRGLLRLFWRKGGIELAATGAFLHWLYHLYASAVYVIVLIRVRAWQFRAQPTPCPMSARDRRA